MWEEMWNELEDEVADGAELTIVAGDMNAEMGEALQRAGREPTWQDERLHLLVAETTGALAASFMTILRLLARQTRLPGATDNTRYGEGRASPRSFLTHHVANISTAIQAADAQTILNAASARMLRVSYGVM